MRALAVSAPAKIDGIPSLKEQGIDVVLGNWRGIFGAPGITPAQRDALVEAGQGRRPIRRPGRRRSTKHGLGAGVPRRRRVQDVPRRGHQAHRAASSTRSASGSKRHAPSTPRRSRPSSSLSLGVLALGRRRDGRRVQLPEAGGYARHRPELHAEGRRRRGLILLGVWLLAEAFTGGWRERVPDDPDERGEHAFHAARLRVGQRGPVRADGADRTAAGFVIAGDGAVRAASRAASAARASLRDLAIGLVLGARGVPVLRQASSTSTCRRAGCSRCWAARASERGDPRRAAARLRRRAARR